jgi:uncharacterized protein (TIGR03000 family)
MSRHLIAIGILLGLPAFVLAQLPPPPPPAVGGGFGGGFGGFRGGARPSGQSIPNISPFMPNISPLAQNISPVGKMVNGGFVRPNHRNVGFPVWGVGGWFPYYGFDMPYNYPYPMTVEVPVPVFVPVQPPSPPVILSGEAQATLVLQFPVAAEVWVNGKKGEGDPQIEWTLTSPSITKGTDYTFDVKARWKVNGKTYEYTRTVAVAAGNRSKALVVSGTEIKE